MPTSQSARLRPRAASASGSYSLARPQMSKPLRIASGVSEEIHSRLTGFRMPPPRRCSGKSVRLRARRRSRRRCATRGATSDLPHDLELIFGFLVDDQRPLLREHRQQVAPPLLPFRLDLVRLRQRCQVPDGPRNHVAVALQIAFPSFVAPSTRAMSRATEGFSASTAMAPDSVAFMGTFSLPVLVHLKSRKGFSDRSLSGKRLA